MTPDAIARLNAALAGRYIVDREIGAGGMATVYLAEDVKHHRKVAIKVLREDLGASVGGARFLREIEIAAQLQHPNILPLLDSGEADKLLYYVMPFVEGQSLRQRLAHERELPIVEAVRLVTELVDALAYAHSRGVVHRDIKPDNVMLSGRHALITDFGVARAVSEAKGSTITTLGVALGTPAYMSPEQATADPNVDHRADIYAAGVVAYELLAGRTPFHGSTPQQMLAAHVTETPDSVAKYRPGVSQQLDDVVMKCLAKRPADRWQTSGDLLAAIEPLATPSGGTQPTSARISAVAPAPSRRRAGIAVAAIIILGAVAWAVARPSAPSFVLGKTSQVTTDPGLELFPAMSPDGKLVAYAAGTPQQMRIFIRPLAGGRTIQLTDDSVAVETQPRWSPDGNQLLFLVDGGVSVASALGGAAKPVVPASASAPVLTATWSPDGKEIAFGRGDSLLAAPLAGGSPRLIGTVGRSQPVEDCDWSRNGRWLACVDGNFEYSALGPAFGNIAPSVIRVFPAAGGTPVVFTEDSAKLNQSPRWAPASDQLFYVSNRDGARDVFVRRVSRSGRGDGAPVRITTGANAHSISTTGDGHRLAYSVFTSQANLWSLPIPDATTTAAAAVQVTSGSQTVESMMASRDGKWIVYDSDIGGPAAIFRVPAGGGAPQQLAAESFDLFAGDLSPDGREVAYHSWRNGTRDIEVKALDGSQPIRVTDTPGQESFPVWSPDGSALAFFDQKRPFTAFVVKRAAGKWGVPVRVAAGGAPRWLPDGRLIYSREFVNPAGGESGGGLEIVVSNADGSDVRVVYRPGPRMPLPGRITAAVDGRTIYFKAADPATGGQIWAVPVTGGAPRLLVRFTDPLRPSTRTDFTVDAKRFYFRIENRQSDIWVAELTNK